MREREGKCVCVIGRISRLLLDGCVVKVSPERNKLDSEKNVVGVNFINILKEFFYVRKLFFGFYMLTVYICNFLMEGQCKMLVKLTFGVNFINILRASLLRKSVCEAFMFLQFSILIFGQKEISTKFIVKC